MAKQCFSCGAQIADDAFACDQCGAIQIEGEYRPTVASEQAQPEPVVQQRPEPVAAKKRKLSWWMVAVPVVLALVIVAACFWQPIAVAIAPKAMLGFAMGNTTQAMAGRTENGPLHLLVGTVDLNKPQRSEVDLSFKGANIPETEISVAMIADPEAKAFLLSAAAPSAEQIQLYVDTQSAAASYGGLNGGQFYGLTFKTFRQDILKSVLAPQNAEEQVRVDQIGHFLDQLDLLLNSERGAEISLEPYLKVIADFSEKLKMESGSDRIELDGKEYTCDTISYSFTMKELLGLCYDLLDVLQADEYFLDAFSSMENIPDVDAPSWEEIVSEIREELEAVEDEMEGTIRLTYYLRKGKVVYYACHMTYETDGEQMDGKLTCSFGADPGKSDFILKYHQEFDQASVDRETITMTLKSAIEDDGKNYKHSLTFVGESSDDGNVKAGFITRWNRDTGRWLLNLSAEDNGYTVLDKNLELTLKTIEGGFSLAYDFKGNLNQLFQPEVSTNNEGELHIVLRFTQGEKLEKPSFVNLDKWDEALMEDIQELLQSMMPQEPVDPDYTYPL